ncbi:putative glycoside hydrolase family 15 protein [Amycolatopsis sp. GA6-003]|uniref:putative glycoside hydrolase family 15 protein n=1 Tax=Amycolatopsis sp. GA6-003 TaxID=2652444 RepID=UPI0039173918
MPKAMLTRAHRRRAILAAVLVLAAGGLAGCAESAAQVTSAPPPEPLAPCAWWYGIGQPPSQNALKLAAQRYEVVVLNADQGAAMRKLHELNPQIKVLVYKDLSSTRNYPGAVVDGKDAQFLPTGIGYVAAQQQHPEWFATDNHGNRIEWQGYPRHWQMTVWDPAYQQAWSSAVVSEVQQQGWDGVLADNDFNSLSHYSAAVLAGTSSASETDRKLRDGLDAFLSLVGDAFQKAGKEFVPNVSETHLTPGRWTAHSRFGGAMEENFGFREDAGSGGLLTFRGNEFQEMRAQAALGESRLLLVTRTRSEQQDRAGYASAALLAGPRTCWTPATTDDYRNPEWSPLQNSGLGEAVDAAGRLANGVWTRTFTNGWVAVNPTSATQTVTPPPGLVAAGEQRQSTPSASPTSSAPPAPVRLAAADGLVLVKPK